MSKNFLVVSFLVLIMAVCSCGDKEQGKVDTEKRTGSSEPFDSLTIELAGRDSLSVFDLLLEKHEVKFIGSAVGNFIHVIDSVSINQDFGWMYSVNDSMGDVASDKYITKNGDVVKWHYRGF